LIFLTVGSWHNGFDRLVKAVDEFKGTGVISEPVVGQIGYSTYKPSHIDYVDFYTPDHFRTMLGKASVIISHAGFGTVAEALKEQKPIIIVPRKSSLGEHNDDHQFATAEWLEQEHRVLVAYDVSDLPKKIREVQKFIPARKNNCNCRIEQVIAEFIENTMIKKYGNMGYKSEL
jgi:UDP-N-acetylglucosamine transferase subunit ALG13